MRESTTRRRVLAAAGTTLAGLTGVTSAAASDGSGDEPDDGDGDGSDGDGGDGDAPGNSGDHREDDGRGEAHGRGGRDGDERESGGDGDEHDGEDDSDDDDGDDGNDDDGDDGNDDDTGNGGSGGEHPDPTVEVTRSNDGSAFTGGQTNQVDLAVDASRQVLIRDRYPSAWSVVAGDAHATYGEGGEQYVEFDAAVADGTRNYLAEAPDDLASSGTHEFGPVEYSVDGETWTALEDTATVVVVGQST